MPSIHPEACDDFPLNRVALGPPPERTLYVHEGDQFEPAPTDEVIHCAKTLLADRIHPGRRMLTPTELQEFLMIQLSGNPRTTFAALLLDARCRLITYVELFQGTVDVVYVPQREVIRTVIEHNAASVVFARGEPSGYAEPTEKDQQHYRDLRDALGLLEVRVLDYFVVGSDVVSAARGRTL